MKMPRSQSENDNVQFVQELAEVDGPFESPININFRDLTKLELPALVWNRGDTRPKKMKITNTGHTVIISGKWKSERPYLTGGPLTGKYVFSQIHFHWGQDNIRGSEHQVCGEGYPLEMHVAHFKTEYLTQECALREKDGMVVVVYLFKLQEEPNNSLKKIINLLPCVKQASTSHPIDPRPILSLCNPFTEDYFMYWGSVVTSTCAHILLWVICREPFGISREQVDEFRKIMDSSQQPIARNSRDIQPLHKRNVFHVNASKHLDEPLLPVKKILGCYCKGSEENMSFEQNNACTCKTSNQTQEEVEGGNAENPSRNDCTSTEGMQALQEKASLPASGCFPNQTIVVQTATVHSVSIVLKRFGSDPVDHSCPDSLQPIKSQDDSGKLTSQSCCFFSTSDTQEIKTDKRKIRDRKRPFNSLRAFSQIMSSLEALKTHTFKKLKEIESINQEIKGIKPLFQDTEDKQWLRKIEKMMSKKKGFTIKTSQGCLRELKKLARECNFDKFFDSKTLPEMNNSEKFAWAPGDGNGKTPQPFLKKEEATTKNASNGKIKYPEKAQKLIQSFFEDIKDTDDLQQTVKKDLNYPNFCGKQAGDANSISSVGKGYITQNMFKLGNLGDRFFTEVTGDDIDMNKEHWENEKPEEKLLILKELNELKKATWSKESQKITPSEEPEPETKLAESKKEPLIPLHRANVSIAISKTSLGPSETYEKAYQESCPTEKDRRIPSLDSLSDRKFIFRHRRRHRPSPQKTFERIYSKRLINSKNRELLSLANARLIRALEAKAGLPEVQLTSSDMSTESLDTQSMILEKLRRQLSRKDFWPFHKSSVSRFARISPKKYGKISCKKFEGYYIEKKNLKDRKTRRQKRKTWHTISTSRDWKALILNSKMKRAKFKLEIESTSNTTTTTESDTEKPISPERKKLRLENKKLRLQSPRENKFFSDDELTEEETKRSPRSKLSGHQEDKILPSKTENVEAKDQEAPKPLEGHSSREHSIKSLGPQEHPFETSCNTHSSTGSRKNVAEQQERKQSEVFETNPTDEIPKTESRIWPNLMPKNKSLSNVVITPRISTEFSQRLNVEYLDDRKKTNKEAVDFRSPKQSKESNTVQSVKNLFRGISNETYRKSDGEHEHGETLCLTEGKDVPVTLSTGKLKYSVGFLTTSNQVDEELLSKDPCPEVSTKNVLLKRCDAEKYMFLEKVTQEVSLSLKDPNDIFNEMLHQTDSNKSFGISKVDMDPTNAANKDLQTSVSYTTLRRNSTSRPHSAETLSFLMKTIKRKYKKRPHCCKRNSMHYIRKKSSKLFEEDVFRKTSEERETVPLLKGARSLRLSDTAQEEDSKTNEREDKSECSDSKRKVKSPKRPSETKKEKMQKPGTDGKKSATTSTKSTVTTPKSATTTTAQKPVADSQAATTAFQKPAVKKPVNNFIKLNKQMAGKYKRPMTSADRKLLKPKGQQSQSKLATPQPLLKLPQRKRGKIPVRKIDVQAQSTPQTSLQTENNKKPSQKTTKVETPRETRVRSLGCLKFDRFNGSRTYTFRTPFFFSE